MRYRGVRTLSLLFVLLFSVSVFAQQPTKTKRPVKNPPQYPNIIDLDNKDKPQTQPENAPDQSKSAQDDQSPESLSQAMATLALEVRTLVQELRLLNLRQQTQLEMMKMTRVEMRIDHFERELRPIRERLTALETEEQNLYQLMTRESLLAQSANVATLNREQTMQQIRLNHETRLRYVQAEKERLQKVERDLISSLGIYQNIGSESERRIQAAEETLRQMEGNKEVNRKP